MNITKTIASRLFVGFTAFALIVASSPKEVNAQIIGNGGSTGWNRTSSRSEGACLDTAKQRMNTLVNQGEIQALPDGNDWRYRKGNNVIFNVVCSLSGGEVRVDVICFNACDRATFDTRKKIDELMQW